MNLAYRESINGGLQTINTAPDQQIVASSAEKPGSSVSANIRDKTDSKLHGDSYAISIKDNEDIVIDDANEMTIEQPTLASLNSSAQ